MSRLKSLGLEVWHQNTEEGLLVIDGAGLVHVLNARLKTMFGLVDDPATVADLLERTRVTLPDLTGVLDLDQAGKTARSGSVLVRQPAPRRLYWEQIPVSDGVQMLGSTTVFRDASAAGDRDFVNQTFLAMISHDLRTPLSAILGFSELLYHNRQSLTDDEQGELLQSIIRNATELSRFTQIALDIMFLEAKIESFELEVVALDRFVNQWMSDALHRFPARQLIYRNGQNEPSLAKASPSALHRVLHILVEFALAESPGGSPVELSLRRNGTRAHIQVSHQAPDLSPADASALFHLMQPRDLSEHARPLLHRMQLYVANLLAERQHAELTLSQAPDRAVKLDLALPLETSPTA